jgi:hypothetical protein
LRGIYLVINHAWRALGIAMPRPVGAALTFVAVVIAWVFFRAPDFAAATSLLHAMVLGEGFSLPRSWLRVFPMLAASGLNFDGAFHNDLIRVDRAMLALCVGLTAVWLFPNTQQLFSLLRPALPAADGHRESQQSWLAWRPSWQWGCALGVLLAAGFVSLGGESPFLYFRF